MISPFQTKNFNGMIKLYGVLFISGLVIRFFSESVIQKKKLLFFSLFFLFLLIIAVIGKYCFLKQKNKSEKIGLWLLFITMGLANLGIPLIPFIGYDTQNISDWLFYSFLTVALSLGFISYVHLVYKYVSKEKTIGIMTGIPFVIVMVFSVFMIERYENFSVGFIGIGMLFLSGTLKQYPRINAYFEQKSTKRYGNSLDIVNKKKEEKNK